MKKVLFIMLATVAISGCSDCDHGFGPDDCDVSWADRLAGVWALESVCNGQTLDGNSMITAESNTRIRFDNTFYAELDEWNSFTIPTQIISSANGNITVSGQGTITEETNTSVNGQTQGGALKIVMTHNYTGPANFTCSWELKE